MNKFLFLLLVLFLTLKLASAQEVKTEIYIENEYYFTANMANESINIGWRLPITDVIDAHYTFGVNTSSNAENFYYHYPAAMNVAPLWIGFDDNWGFNITMFALTLFVPEGFSFKLPVGNDKNIFISPYIFPLTTDIMRQRDGSGKTITWSGSFGLMVHKVRKNLAIRSKLGYKYNPYSSQFGPQISFGVGYVFH